MTYVIFDLLWLDGHSLMGLPYSERRELLAALALDGEQLADARALVGEGATLLRGERRAGTRGRRGQAPGLDLPARACARGELGEDQARRRARSSSIGGWLPGKGRRSATHRRAAARRLRAGRRAALRRARRAAASASASSTRLGAPARAAASARARRSRRRTTPPRGARLLRAAAGGRGRVQRVDRRRAACASPSTRACARTSRATEVVREDTPDAAGGEHGAAARADAGRAGAALRRCSSRRRSRSAPPPTVEGRELKLSNLDKVLYPAAGFTKRELIDYYAAVAPVLLAHLAGRAADRHALARRRARASRSSRSRRPRTGPSGCARRRVAERAQADRLHARRRPADARVAREPRGDRAAHAARARAGDASARPRSSSTSTPARPATIVECCRVALQLQGMFEHLGLQSFAKTSGSKGLQVYVPLNRARRRATSRPSRSPKAVAELLEQRRAGAGRLAHDQGAPRRQGADRLEPERRAARRPCACTRCAPPSARRSRRRSTGRRCARRSTAAIRRRLAFDAPSRCWSAWPSAATCSRRCSRSCRSCPSV